MTVAAAVTVSIVSTGEADKLPACLSAIVRQRFDGAIRVVLVRNGVDDGSDTIAREIIPDAAILIRDEKRSFAENHNRALRSMPSDFGMALNPDVVLHEDCVAFFVDAMRRHAHCGMAGPLLRFPDGLAQPSARRFPRLAGTIVRRTPLRRLVERSVMNSAHYLPPPDSDRMVDWMLGAVLFVRRTAWDSIGGFDEGFRPLYVEDIDLAWRMWNAGWEVWQIPEAIALHEHQAVTDRVFFNRRTIWHARGMLRFVRKHPGAIFGSGARSRRATS